jgi:LysR family transcriptional regulator for bpeEF and oprC
MPIWATEPPLIVAEPVSGTDTLLAAALQGLGSIQVPRYAIARHMDTGRLVEILPHTPPTSMPVHIFYHSRRHLSVRVRAFIEWVVNLYRDIDERT